VEGSAAAECKNKREPLFSETVLFARRNDKNTSADQMIYPNYLVQSLPDKTGDFILSNLVPGQFDLNARFFAKYWYLRSIVRENAAMPLGASAANRQSDLARNGIILKLGDRVSGVKVTLAAGAASLRGTVKLAEGESLPARLYLHLVPAEKENAEDVLRYFTTAVRADQTFSFNNLPPGRYWMLARQSDNESQSDATLRLLENGDTRQKIRRAAEGIKTEVELKPCQNVLGYQLPFKISLLKN
jgi:hypothetical protein